MRQRTSAIALLGFVATAIVALGWPSVGAGSSDGIERAGAAGLQSYAWKQVNDEAPWTARAGLQSVKLGGKFYVMGGGHRRVR